MFIIDNQWAFIHAPKTSGTSLKYALRKHCLEEHEGNKEWARFAGHCHCEPALFCLLKHSLGHVDIVKHAPLWFWEELEIVQARHKVIAVFRNPYTRLVSYYCHLQRCFPNTRSTFEDFIHGRSALNMLLSALPDCFAANASQFDFYRNYAGAIKLHAACKMEDKLAGLPIDLSPASIDPLNVASYTKDYDLWYSDELIDHVQAVFKDDFKEMGYSLQPFWR